MCVYVCACSTLSHTGSPCSEQSCLFQKCSASTNRVPGQLSIRQTDIYYPHGIDSSDFASKHLKWFTLVKLDRIGGTRKRKRNSVVTLKLYAQTLLLGPAGGANCRSPVPFLPVFFVQMGERVVHATQVAANLQLVLLWTTEAVLIISFWPACVVCNFRCLLCLRPCFFPCICALSC